MLHRPRETMLWVFSGIIVVSTMIMVLQQPQQHPANGDDDSKKKSDDKKDTKGAARKPDDKVELFTILAQNGIYPDIDTSIDELKRLVSSLNVKQAV